MKINYKDADGRIIELEVIEEFGNFYLESIEAEKKNERRETRRHTLLSQFHYEDRDYFDCGVDLCADQAVKDAVARALDQLSERQRHLFTKVFLEGWTYTELAAQEGRHESTIRKATEKEKEKFLMFFSADYPI